LDKVNVLNKRHKKDRKQAVFGLFSGHN